jgi:molecular chaperone DnaK (HSP70)
MKTVRYRFTRPALEEGRSKWVDEILVDCLTFALRVSIHFSKEYTGQMVAERARAFLDQAYRLGGEIKNIDKAGVLEPVAAGTAYLDQSNQRSVALIVDIGAGTSDLALFLTVAPSGASAIERARQLGKSVSIKKAGDFLDSSLIEIICAESELSRIQLVQVDLNIRRWKEDLFKFGEAVPSVEGQLLPRVLRHNFIRNSAYLEIESEIREQMDRLFSESSATIELLAKSAQFPLGSIDIVPVGGGSSMPFFETLARIVFRPDGCSVGMRLNRSLPRIARSIPEFPQLAVAVGGTIASIVTDPPTKQIVHRGFR